jgi:electron transport complex protein RnfB
MWTAVITIGLIALLAGLALGYASRRLPANESDLVERVNKLLPQTQCAQCGYPGCRPYAAAIARDEAAINLCPPGGDDTVRRKHSASAACTVAMRARSTQSSGHNT